MTDHALRLLRENPRLAALAEFPFDFSLDRAEYGHGEPVRLVSGGSLEVVAGDAGGGTYFVCEDGSVLYADSEGSAGLVGSGFDEAFEILIGLGGEDDRDEEEEEYYGYEAARAELRVALGFPERSREELEALLDAAQARTWPDFLLLNAEEGCAYELIGPPPPPLWERVPVPGGFEGDPASEPLYTWTDLALAQGRTNLARAAHPAVRRDLPGPGPAAAGGRPHPPGHGRTDAARGQLGACRRAAPGGARPASARGAAGDAGRLRDAVTEPGASGQPTSGSVRAGGRSGRKPWERRDRYAAL
ncbi:hypothetical protein [Streptomyces sp. NBC_00019]|uniref:hypothetical protein n=1 Tax=Streptomyces sp. NBC_00019 TaxID=2975623 RepID=UPI00324F2C90